MRTTRHTYTTPYQDQLRAEAEMQPGEISADYIARLNGMVAQGHTGAVNEMRRLKGTYSGRMFLAAMRAEAKTTTLRSVSSKK